MFSLILERKGGKEGGKRGERDGRDPGGREAPVGYFLISPELGMEPVYGTMLGGVCHPSQGL